jgi:fructokinase
VRVTLDERGIPCYEICEGVAWDKLQLNDEVLALANRCDAICFGTLAQRSEMSRKAIYDLIEAIPAERNALVIYDINLRQHYYSKELIEASLNRCNILKINDEEFSTIAPMLNFVADDFEVGARELIERYGLKMVVVTCGEKGSLVVTKNEVSKLETPKVEVVDTVGAGDSFTAALCVGLLRGKEIREVHRKAVEVAAFVCKNAGAMPPYEE